MDKVLKCTVLMTDINDYAKINEIYSEYFTKEQPARIAFAVKDLPAGGTCKMMYICMYLSVCIYV